MCIRDRASKEQESAAARAELADLHGDTETVFENIVKAIRDADSVDARVALREDLSRILSRCVIHAAENFIEIFFRGSEAVPVIVPPVSYTHLDVYKRQVHSGIVLVTLDDQKVWNRETVKDMSNLILSIVFMSRANNESAAKASRLSEIWGRKKDLAKTSGKIVTSECPKWLRVNADKTEFEILEEKVESIRNLFDLRILGYGSVAIVNRANKEKWPVPGKGSSWHTSLVGRLLNNRALLGLSLIHI